MNKWHLGIIVAGSYLVMKKTGSINKTTATLIFSATWSPDDLLKGESAQMHQDTLKKALLEIPFINEVTIFTMGYLRDNRTDWPLKQDEIEIDVAGKSKSETLLAIRPVLHGQNWNISKSPPPEFVHRY